MKQNLSAPVITIDGPSGAGKGTITQLVAKKLGWTLLDSGALYRLTALAAETAGVALEDEQRLSELALSLDVEFVPGDYGEPVNVLLNGNDVTRDIRTETCGNNASKVAPLPSVRAALLQRQRDFQQFPGLVADGRDMGTVVFPDAAIKVFMTASAEERAERRYRQLKDKGEDVKIATLLSEIRERDARDTGRATAPLKPADDAVMLDTTGLGIEEVLAQVLKLVEESIG
ncbi:(d)CMP kinase [Alkalimarinus sediminis]|uniref:Cytidylate kinase n=1 Tax=Alkalimarinus sediminis TaxID=1632866 RepID=A0A9E8HQ44_9ALTE|nr:(d)CMP kinase [Alkalimarinus sediminis]UZW76668.1 (d)CMP kinase [Alkalimarinus sediminis]